ncbi:tetratricopeptide repeat protein [Alicyclobacillus sp.]|uniref:tetratricopeptide repeat protein n=1 Tax=Alicyclobacillus sp. TaxID=61169 RepID=UPI0025C49172|nr:tetratricopeptide repeat protein [Alicyclobacillus sp.]MCL6515532.1 tetratricopeptide repeat protein [Alicyclobacillus sp.]
MLGERWLKVAFSYLYIRDFDRAMEAFRRAIACEPDNPACYFHGSVTALRNEDWEPALAWAEAAARLAPDNVLYQEHLCRVRALWAQRQTADEAAAGADSPNTPQTAQTPEGGAIEKEE